MVRGRNRDQGEGCGLVPQTQKDGDMGHFSHRGRQRQIQSSLVLVGMRVFPDVKAEGLTLLRGRDVLAELTWASRPRLTLRLWIRKLPSGRLSVAKVCAASGP